LQKGWFLHLLFLAEAAIEPRSARHGSITVAGSARQEYRKQAWPPDTQSIIAFITGI
jgi:hypothetical protein